MSEETTIYLVFGILFSIGLIQLLFPGKVIDLAVNTYAKLGMKVNRNSAIWSNMNMRIMGALYLACTGFLFYVILQAR